MIYKRLITRNHRLRANDNLFILCSSRTTFYDQKIYNFTKNYLMDWFLKLPSYVAFNTWLNKLNEVFRVLSQSLIAEFTPDNISLNSSLVEDSLPIITCSGKGAGNKEGLLLDKEHVLFWCKITYTILRKIKKIPYSEHIVIKASENNLTIFKENWAEIGNRTFLVMKYILMNLFLRH